MAKMSIKLLNGGVALSFTVLLIKQLFNRRKATILLFMTTILLYFLVVEEGNLHSPVTTFPLQETGFSKQGSKDVLDTPYYQYV